jgi:hypothetical protein
MSDDPKLRVVKKEWDSSLALSPWRSAIVARGRRDTALKDHSLIGDVCIGSRGTPISFLLKT